MDGFALASEVVLDVLELFVEVRALAGIPAEFKAAGGVVDVEKPGADFHFRAVLDMDSELDLVLLDGLNVLNAVSLQKV